MTNDETKEFIDELTKDPHKAQAFVTKVAKKALKPKLGILTIVLIAAGVTVVSAILSKE